MKNKFLLLYSSNIAVNGKYRSAIYQLIKGELIIIPTSFYKVLCDLKKMPYSAVLKKYQAEKKIFNSYIEYLFKENLAFFTTTPETFPRLKIEYHTAEIINCAIVEFVGLYDFDNLMNELNTCNCKHMQLYFHNKQTDTFQRILSLLESVYTSSLRSLELIINHFDSFQQPSLTSLITKHQKLKFIRICNSSSNATHVINGVEVLSLKVSMSTYINDYQLDNFLVVNKDYFMESHFFNPYFNKKVYIGVSGEIKNDQYSKKKFGNIDTNKLSKIVNTSAFQKIWKKIPKQLKESEFRYCLYNPSRKINVSKFRNCKVFAGKSLKE